MTVMSFLETCRDGAGHRVRRDPRIANFGIIPQLSRQLVELIDQFNCFQVVRASGFDVHLSYLDYRRTQEIDWSPHTMTS